MLEAKNLDVSYPAAEDRVNILSDVSISVPKGKVTVLIGPSGSGKSTLLKSLALLIKPDSGTVIMGDSTFTFPTKSNLPKSHFKFDLLTGERQRIGVVFQDLHLIPHWTNRMNIERPLRSLSLETKEKIQDLISIFKMEDFIDKYPAECSRGEEQRVAIARAILMNPEYLLLDEVTSALDPEIVVSIFKYCTVLKEEGTGVFLITHYIPFAKKVADNIYFMANGKIVEEGKKDILTKPSTERLSTFIDNLDYIIGR